jgi:hypothetical protein
VFSTQTEISKHVPKLLPYLSVVTTPEGWFTLMDAKLQVNHQVQLVPKEMRFDQEKG